MHPLEGLYFLFDLQWRMYSNILFHWMVWTYIHSSHRGKIIDMYNLVLTRVHFLASILLLGTSFKVDFFFVFWMNCFIFITSFSFSHSNSIHSVAVFHISCFHNFLYVISCIDDSKLKWKKKLVIKTRKSSHFNGWLPHWIGFTVYLWYLKYENWIHKSKSSVFIILKHGARGTQSKLFSRHSFFLVCRFCINQR